MKLITIPALLLALLLIGCGQETINRQDALILQKPISLTIGDDQKERVLTDASFNVQSAEPGQSYKQTIIARNRGNKAVKLLIAVRSPLWLDSDGYRKIYLLAKKSKAVDFYFVGDEEARGKKGRIDFTVATR